MAFPEVVSRERWLEARLRLLAEEKNATRRRDALNSARRRLPMVRIEKGFHTYSTYGRGNEYLSSSYPMLDLTALGRQEG
jgi:predicted dithiol-disulfide oxidoreductase (DUF899 family)